MKKRNSPKRTLTVVGRNHSVSELKEIAHQHHTYEDSQHRAYKLGFWIFFFLALFSVLFSVLALNSIYTSFKVVTKILDESFERTNLVMDITSSRITSCESKVRQCQDTLDVMMAEPPPGDVLE
jgi:hypothetical protein